MMDWTRCLSILAAPDGGYVILNSRNETVFAAKHLEDALEYLRKKLAPEVNLSMRG
jgi:hypothetical protein